MNTYLEDHEYLIYATAILILALFATSLLFLLLTLVKRYRKIKKTIRRSAFQGFIDSTLFSMLFNEITEPESMTQFKLLMSTSVLFKKVAIKSIVALHNNYSGHYRTKLENFYVQSGLVNYSMKKIKSHQWPDVVEGLRDLSNLKYGPAFDQIASLIQYPNEFVRKEALLGVIRLRGLGELIKRKDLLWYLDDWTQSNILMTLKTLQSEAPENMETLLSSSNPSMVLMGARLIEHFQYIHQTPALQHALEQAVDRKLQTELQDIILRLNPYMGTAI